MFADEVMSIWKDVLRKSKNVQHTSKQVIQQMEELGEKFGFDQAQILEIREFAFELGISRDAFQPLLDKNSASNFPVFK